MTRRAISRRALLGSGGAVVAIGAVGVVTDRSGALGSVIRSLGIDPRRKPAVQDELVLAAARRGQSLLLRQTRAVAAAHTSMRTVLTPVARRLLAQLDHLGGPDDRTEVGTSPSGTLAALDHLSASYTTAGTQCADDAAHAVSGELAQVLASIAVSLSQDVVLLAALRRELA